MRKRRLLLVSWMLLLFVSSRGQNQNSVCDSIYQRALLYLQKDSFNIALNKLAAYKICNPDSAGKADSLIKTVFHVIDSKRVAAIASARTIKIQRDSLERQYKKSVILYAQKELAEINLLPRIPINTERRRRLELLLAPLATIGRNPLSDSIKGLIAESPSPVNRQLLLPDDLNRLGVHADLANNCFFVIYSDSVEAWDSRNFQRRHVYRLSDLPDRAKGGIVWHFFDRIQGILYIEIEYSPFAIAAEDSLVSYPVVRDEYKVKYHGFDLVSAEKEVFSIRLQDPLPHFEGVTRDPIVKNPFHEKFESEEEDYRYRDVPHLHRDSLGVRFVDQSKKLVQKVPESIRKEFTGDISGPGPGIDPFLRPIAIDRDSVAAIYEASSMVYGIASEPAPLGSIPLAASAKGELTILNRMIYQQKVRGHYYEQFEPAAINFEKKIAFLNQLLIAFADDEIRVVDTIVLYGGDMDKISFTPDGSALLITWKRGDISKYDLKTHSEHTFLADNHYRYAELSDDGQSIYFIRPGGALEIWRMACFGKNGWSSLKQ